MVELLREVISISLGENGPFPGNCAFATAARPLSLRAKIFEMVVVQTRLDLDFLYFSNLCLLAQTPKI